MVFIDYKCEHKDCSNKATHKIIYSVINSDNETLKFDHFICDKCAQNLISNGLAYRSQTHFKLLEYISLDLYFEVSDFLVIDDPGE